MPPLEQAGAEAGRERGEHRARLRWREAEPPRWKVCRRCPRRGCVVAAARGTRAWSARLITEICEAIDSTHTVGAAPMRR